jgi:hypothetical protein
MDADFTPVNCLFPFIQGDGKRPRQMQNNSGSDVHGPTDQIICMAFVGVTVKLKSIFLASVLAVLGASASATTLDCAGALNGSAQQCGSSFTAAGAFSSSFTFGDATGASAWLSNGSTTYQFINNGGGSMFGHTLSTFGLGGTLPSGTWSVFVNGTSGQYQGGVSYSLPATSVPVAAPVPEPESYAMMLAGLGALGMLGRRRKAK